MPCKECVMVEYVQGCKSSMKYSGECEGSLLNQIRVVVYYLLVTHENLHRTVSTAIDPLAHHVCHDHDASLI